MKKIRVFEAFAGVGSQRMALRNLNIDYEVVGISEIDKFALKSYEAIHGDCPSFGDISKINPHDLPDMDLFTYSFPCQDLSVAGKQEGLGKGTRSGLLYECEKVIEAKRPKYLLLENVKNLVGKKFKGDFDKWLEYLQMLGYTNYWKVLNAKDYGVPQNRERVFVISILNDKQGFKFPNPVKLNKSIKDVLEDNVDEKYYMNKPFKIVNKSNEIAELQIKANRSMKAIQGEYHICPCLTSMQGGHREPKILQVAKTNDNYEQNSRVYGTNGVSPTLTARDFKDPKKILEYKGKKVELPCIVASRGRNLKNTSDRTVGGPTEQILGVNTRGTSNTITTVQKDNYAIEENYRVRKLTPLECWRLMSFSDEDFYKAKNAGISNSQLYKQAGNSIVTKVLEGIFKNIFIEWESELNILGGIKVEQYKMTL